MDPVEQWLRDKAERNTLMNVSELADEWADRTKPLEDFLATVEGPVMIGLDPVVYPACTRCGQAWQMRRTKGVWAWFPDCSHKSATCKLVKAS